MISIIIPCFNHGHFIQEALESVEACSGDFETIVINDGSTDAATIEILYHLEKNGYKIINQANAGLGAARNAGIAASKGKYILPLDSDNKIRPEYLVLSKELLDRDSDLGVVYGHAQLFGDESGIWEMPTFDAGAFFVNNFIDACAVFRREVWEQAGGYDTKMPLQGYEDWDFWISAHRNGWRFQRLDEVVFDYRVRGNSMNAEYRESQTPIGIRRYLANKHLEFFQECYEVNFLKATTLDFYDQNPFRAAVRMAAKKVLPARVFRKIRSN